MTTKASAKGKNKKPFETTLGRAPANTNGDSIDLSHIRKPINTSIFGLRQVLQLFETATSEVRHYVAYECDIMYECRICRTIFRSLANFILHKRNYCRESYNPNDHSNWHNNCKENEFYVSREECNTSATSLDKENSGKVSPVPSQSEPKQEAPASDSSVAKPSSARERKNLNYVLRRLQGKQQSTLITNQCMTEDASDESKSSENDDKEKCKSSNLKKNEEKEKCNISLDNISDSKSGVFQTMFHSMIEEQKGELMRTEVMEIHNILENNEAILGANGKIIASSTEKAANFTCTVCNQKFSTKKTLTYHIKYKHNNTRLIYQCPECNDTFASAWSVFRHLYKIHRKTSAQVKRLRNQIHSNIIRRDQQREPKSGGSSKETTEVVSDSQEKAEMENQWMEDLEGDNDLQRCGGCGRKFERKAALHSHSQFCAKRIALYNTIKEGTTKKGTHPQEQDKGKALKVASNNAVPETNLKGSRKRKQLMSYRLCRVDDSEDDKDSKSSKSNVNDIEASHTINEVIEVNDDESEGETFVNMEKEDVNENLKDLDQRNSQEDVELEMPKLTPQIRPESRNSDNDDVIYIDTIKLSSSEVANINKDSRTKTDILNGEEKECVTNEDEKNDNEAQSVKKETLNLENNNKMLLELENLKNDKRKSSESAPENSKNDQRKSSESENSKTDKRKSSESENSKTDKRKSSESENSKTDKRKSSESEPESSKSHKRKSSESEPENSKRPKSDSETSSRITLEMKSLQYMDKQKRCCLPCKKTFKSFKTLLKHMAAHFSWYRYQCRFCSFLSYNRSKCDRHVEMKHSIKDEEKLKNTVMHIPHWKTINNASEFKCCLKKHRKKKHQQPEGVEVDEHPESGLSDSNSSSGLGQEETTQSSINNEEIQEVILVEKPNVQDPSIRKMIMEVIFGNAEASEPEEKEENLSSNSEGSSRPSETEDFLGFQNPEAPNNVNSRPVRNRVPTVQKDFLYDMGQILKTGREDVPKKDKKAVKTYSKEKVKKSVTLNSKTAVLCNKSVQSVSDVNSVQDINMNSKDVKNIVESGD